MNKILTVLLTIFLILSVFLLNIGIVLAIEDYTSWQEVDPNGRLTRNTANVTWAGLTEDEDAYVYKNFGDNFFSGDFVHYLTLEVTDYTNGHNLGVWALTNILNDLYDIQNVSGDALVVNLAGATPKLTCFQVAGGGGLQGNSIDIVEDTPYYLKIVRDEAVGDDGTLYCYIYDDEERTSLVGTSSVALDSKVDFKYVHTPITWDFNQAAQPSSGWVSDLSMGAEDNPLYVPTVITYPTILDFGGATFVGWGSSENGELLEAAFDVGLSSGNYTIEFDANISGNSFFAEITTDNLTIGTTYYYQAKARNLWGWGYGLEKEFQFWPQQLRVDTNEATVVQTLSGNFTAAFSVTINPVVGANVSARMSTSYPSFASPITLYTSYAYGGTYAFDTWNGTVGTEGVLLPDTTYYYQGYAEHNSITWYGNTKSFTTANATIPDKPVVSIIDIKDVGRQYGEDYVVEVKGKVYTGNTTDWIINVGFQFSQDRSPSGELLPTFYDCPVHERAPDNTFTAVYSLANADWYSGQRLYFRAYTTTPYYGKIYSILLSIELSSRDNDTIETIGDEENEPPEVISIMDDMFDRARLSLGLVGTMGTWAFLGIILLITSLIFGGIMIAAPDGLAKSAVALAWILTSIAIIGGFIFTGKLGLWPIFILVGGTVSLILLVLSLRFSGGRQSG